MSSKERSRELIIGHCEKYPLLQMRDLFKYVYQSAFGCEHLVSSAEAVTDYLRKEYETMPPGTNKTVEALDGDYSRVGLGLIGEELSAERLAELFCLSAKAEPEGRERLEEKLGIIRELIYEGKIPFSISELESLLDEWRSAGYPAIRHSEAFRKAYHPAYRVIANEYLPLINDSGVRK